SKPNAKAEASFAHFKRFARFAAVDKGSRWDFPTCARLAYVMLPCTTSHTGTGLPRSPYVRLFCYCERNEPREAFGVLWLAGAFPLVRTCRRFCTTKKSGRNEFK